MHVSIIMSVYNRAPLFVRSLVKYNQQTYKDFELVVVDDGSTEGDLYQALEVHAANLNFQYIRLEHSGVRSPNIGYLTAMEAARGEFWIVTQPENLIPKDAIERVLGIYGRINVDRPLEKKRRVGLSRYQLSQGMQQHIDEVNWQANVDMLQNLPGFWTDRVPHGRVNKEGDLNGGLLLDFAGMRAIDWDWIGRFVRTEKVGMSDRDLHLRDGFLRRSAYTPPFIYVYHQYHVRYGKEWANLASPHPVYRTEAQARLQECVGEVEG